MRESILNKLFNTTRKSRKEVKIQKLLNQYPAAAENKETCLKAIAWAVENHNKNRTPRQSVWWTLQEMAQNMYDCRGDIDVSLETCYGYIEELFTTRSIKGFSKEMQCIKWLNSTSSFNWGYRKSTPKEDEEFNIDIVGYRGDDKVFIQLKPESYKYTDAKTKIINEKKEEKSGQKIWYIYYNQEGEFIL